MRASLPALSVCTLLFPAAVPCAAQLCALDVFVANDQSGSVSAIENTQSRQFISALFNGMQPWGNGPGESRMAIADWDSPSVWLQFGFPSVGANYTTLLSDVLAYQTAPRALLGGTDPYTALLSTFQQIGQTPVVGRVAKPVIVLMTDAACVQVPAALSTLATQVKNNGVYLIVVAIEAASSCPALAGTNVASPGGYFAAPTYSDLVSANVQLVQDMINAGCVGAPDPTYDLTIALNAFNASGCVTPTPNYSVDYTVTNGPWADFTGALVVSFYDGDPSLPTTNLLAVQNAGAMNIAAGGSYSGTFTHAALGATNMLYAVVNYDGAAPGHAPPVPGILNGTTAVADESATFNNESNGAARVNDPVTCPPQAIITTGISSNGTGCNDLVTYEITICNTGDAPALLTPTLPIAVPGAVLLTDLNQPGNYASELDWATYYGGTLLEEGRAVVTDAAGNVYLAGTTRSTASIATAGARLVAAPANRNAFLAKFNSAGVRQWATYYGGAGADYGMGVTCDAAGNVYLVGFTESTTGIATAGTFQTAFSGSTDAYIVKFSSAGVRQWGSYFGGTSTEEGYSVALDGAGGVYLAGITQGSTNLASAGAHQTAFAGISDQFLAKFNATTGARLWSTYHGGANEDIAANVACDPAGNAYLVGETTSPAGIASAGSFQPAFVADEVYLAKFNSAGVRQWSTYFGGPDVEEQPSVACDANGSVFLSGTTDSDAGIAYNTLHQSFRGGNKDGFVAKFDGAGNVVWSTYAGGSDTEDLTDVAIDPTGKVVVAGFTQSPDLIATTGSFKETIDPASDDAFVMKFYGDGTLSWGTYFGGDDNEEQYSVAVNTAGDIYIAGFTPSLIDVATAGAHQTVNNSNDDAYLAKFGEHELPLLLGAGACIVRQYVYDYSGVAAGTYDLSMGIAATAVNVGDAAPSVLPDQGFNAGGFLNIDGFNGAVHVTDNAVIPVAGTACPSGDLIAITVNIPATSSCGNGNYATATITITNSSGTTVNNTDLHLDLTGAGATFASEPYNLSAGTILAAPNVLDPAYPFVPYALYSFTGSQFLPVIALPPGTSTFQVDLNIGGTATNLSAQLDSIHTSLNATGQSNVATDAAGVVALTVPAIGGFACPGSIVAGGTLVFTGIAITGAASVQWSSTTVPVLAGGGSPAAPTLSYTPTPLDVANGFVAISLTALSAAGCDATESCQIAITNVAYDYGDAPIEYDMNINYQPPAAASTLFSGLVLGTTGPDPEPLANNSVLADGDGVEEDALSGNPYTAAWPGPGVPFALPVEATNTTTTKAYLHAYIDWNADGDFLDTLESSLNTVTKAAASGTATHLMQFVVPVGANPLGLFYIRLRLSIDSMAVTMPYMAAPRGETEDYVWESVGILPIELLAFSGTDEGARVRLDWSTATEANTGHFVVERSADASAYLPVGSTPAAGNSQAAVHYSLYDPDPLRGVAYYRLIEVDLDGAARTFGPIAVVHDGSGSPWIERTDPGAVVVHGLPEAADVRLSDMTGRTVPVPAAGEHGLRVSGLPTGVYGLTYHDPAGATHVLRFALDR